MVIRSQTRIVITILLALLFLWIAYPSQYYFLNDDFFHIPLAAQKNFVHGTLLRPVSDITLWFDHLIWGKEAFGYHLTNVLIHLVNTLLVYVLARQLFMLYGDDGAGTQAGSEMRSGWSGRAELKAWLAALLFLIYAFHSEPVLWIIGRGGSLSTLFFLASCTCYLKREGSSWYFFFSLLFFCIGLFVYESIWIFPLIAWFFSIAAVRGRGGNGGQEVKEGKKEKGGKGRKEAKEGKEVKKGRSWREEGIWLVWIVGLFGLYLLFRCSQTSGVGGSYETRMLPHGNFFRLLYNYNGLFARCFLPPMASGEGFLLSYALLMILVGLAVLYVVKKRKAWGLLGLLGGCFLVSLLPAITLGIDTHHTESERFIYLPTVFCVLLLTELIFLAARSSGVATVLLLLLITLHGIQFRQASLSYRYAGKIARRSLELIDSKTPVSTLYLFHLPSQYQGALIFRSGFQAALAWIDPGLAYRSLVVLNQEELKKRRDSFPFIEQDIRAAFLPGARILADTIEGGWRVRLPDTSFVFFPGRDRIFYWTDSSLGKIGSGL